MDDSTLRGKVVRHVKIAMRDADKQQKEHGGSHDMSWLAAELGLTELTKT